MSRLIDGLRALNRKERFFVLNEALGLDADAPQRLGESFRDKLYGCLEQRGIDVTVPEQCFLAMDYHLDWIELALYLADKREIQARSPFPAEGLSQINENQQDIDLLVAFDDEGTTHLLLIEAKAYVHWNNRQLNLKASRLREIFGDDGQRRHAVKPHFLLMTGMTPRRVCAADWPAWMKTEGGQPFSIYYELPARRKVTRCDAAGSPRKDGGHLRLDWAGGSPEFQDG